MLVYNMKGCTSPCKKPPAAGKQSPDIHSGHGVKEQVMWPR